MKRINKIQLKNSIAAITILFFLMAVGLSSCQKDMEGKIYQLSDQKMMDEILKDLESNTRVKINTNAIQM